MTTPAHVHVHMTWGGADDVDVRWGQPIFVPLHIVKATSLGSLVSRMEETTSGFWVVRLDVGNGGLFPRVEDTRTILYGTMTSPPDNDIISDHIELLDNAIPSEQMATTNIRLVGSIILHTEM